MMFSNKQLKSMILPLLAEQLLLLLVGLSDTVVVSYAGEAAVSGVSLVNSFNTIFIMLFTALTSGGAVIVSQYIGRSDYRNASRSVSQLLMFSTLFSIVISIPILIFNRPILTGLFGSVEEDVMEACVTYLLISVYSYPFLAIYNAGTALYRSIGNTKTTMNISIIANIINIVGNCIGVFYFHAGVAGVAYPSLLSRAFSAIVITYLCYKKENGVYYQTKDIFTWDNSMLKSILRIAVPNGVENGIFQFVKVALSSIVAMFGTYQIAANGIAQSIWSISAVIVSSMGTIFITVIGQCMGAGETEQAEYYFKKLLKWTLLSSLVWEGLICLAMPLIVKMFSVSSETANLIILLVFIHNAANAVCLTFAQPLGNGLRAAGDVTFTMVISLFTTIGVRLIFSVILGIWLNLGVIGIAIAMCLDWAVRGIIYIFRFRQGKWKTLKVIEG